MVEYGNVAILLTHLLAWTMPYLIDSPDAHVFLHIPFCSGSYEITYQRNKCFGGRFPFVCLLFESSLTAATGTSYTRKPESFNRLYKGFTLVFSTNIQRIAPYQKFICIILRLIEWEACHQEEVGLVMCPGICGLHNVTQICEGIMSPGAVVPYTWDSTLETP